ncbi:MAG: hypothetical protein J2P32_00085 [Actinobacteria bacterium]|nr:hypothetical protein [Actinomycetota bacterium]
MARRATGGLSVDERVTDARHDIVAVLASWSALVADERRVTRPGRREVTQLSAFLAVHVDWLLAHPAGHSFAEELLAVAAAAREISRSDPARGPELSQCVEEGCDKPMTVIRAATSVEVRCAAGHAWQARQWLHLARRLSARQAGGRSGAHA